MEAAARCCPLADPKRPTVDVAVAAVAPAHTSIAAAATAATQRHCHANYALTLQWLGGTSVSECHKLKLVTINPSQMLLGSDNTSW